LPLPYSTALRLHDAGVPDEMIAERIGIEPAAMPVFCDWRGQARCRRI
jgi:hypothetical protein